MAETIKKYVDQAALEHLIEKLGVREDQKDATVLASAKTYANGLADNYDPAGKAAELVKALEAGQVATNKTNIATNASDITAAKARIQALEDVKYTAITNEEIDGYFAAKKE